MLSCNNVVDIAGYGRGPRRDNQLDDFHIGSLRLDNTNTDKRGALAASISPRVQADKSAYHLRMSCVWSLVFFDNQE